MIQLHNLHVALYFLGFWTLFAGCGLLIANLWLVPAAAFAQPDFHARWRQMLGECLALMAVAGVLLLLVRTGEMDEGTLPRILADLPLVLTQTHFGRIWSLHLVTLALLGGGWAMAPAARASRTPSRTWAACMAGGLLVLAFTYSASSHASDNGDFTLAELNDWVHVVSTSIWGGGIFVFVLLVFPALKGQPELRAAAALRLSASSGAALPWVLITGIYNASRQLSGWDGLLATNYGRVLSVKLVLVGALMLVGAWNRFVLVPRVQRHAGEAHPSRMLFRVLALDAVFMLLAIVMAAILVENEALPGPPALRRAAASSR